MTTSDVERAEALIAQMEDRVVDRVLNRGEHFIDAFYAEYSAATTEWSKTEPPAVLEIATRAGALTTPTLKRIEAARQSKPKKGWFR